MTSEDLEELRKVQSILIDHIDRSDLENFLLGSDAASLDALTLKELISGDVGASRVAHKYANDLAQGLVGAEAHEMSALFFLDYIKSGTGLLNMVSDQKHGGQYLRNRAGNSQYANNIAASLRPGSVNLSTPVRSIAQDGKGCTLRVGNDGSQVISADRVIVTVPSPLYSLIDFQPELPPTKAKLASSNFLGYYAKTVLVFSKPWWRTAGCSGILGSATADGTGPISFSRDTSIPEDEQWSITCFHVGDKGRQWSKLGAKDRQAAVLLQFDVAFSSALSGGVVPKPIKILEKDWSKDAWTRGSPATISRPGTMTSDAGKSLRDPFGRVHFAGTETAYVWKGYMEGAVRSGSRAAGEVIEALQ
jgi:monoamine oxidase